MPRLSGTNEEQFEQLKKYVYQLTCQLNFIIGNIEKELSDRREQRNGEQKNKI